MQSFNFSLFIAQKYNDFVEIAKNAIAGYTKIENGNEVPVWNKEEVDEIVTSQVYFDKGLPIKIIIIYVDKLNW